MSLREQAIQATLRMSRWGGTAKDSEASTQLTLANDASADAARVTKQLLAGADSELNDIRNCQQRAYMTHVYYTLPWQTKGSRILRNSLYIDYTQAMSAHIDEHNRLVPKFLDVYVDLVHNAKYALGKLWKESDYPPPGKMAQAFGIWVDFDKLPADWRVEATSGIPDDEIARLTADAEKRTTTLVQNAVSDSVTRLITALDGEDGFINKLVNYDGGRKGSFHDSLFENLERLVDILPHFNLTNDPVLDAAVNSLRTKVLVHSPDKVRGDIMARAECVIEAQSVLSELADLLKDDN